MHHRSLYICIHACHSDAKHSACEHEHCTCLHRQALVSPEKGFDIGLYASLDELQALSQTWGLWGVQELGNSSQETLQEAMSFLDAALKMHEPLLHRLKAEYLVGPDRACIGT